MRMLSPVLRGMLQSLCIQTCFLLLFFYIVIFICKLYSELSIVEVEGARGFKRNVWPVIRVGSVRTRCV